MINQFKEAFIYLEIDLNMTKKFTLCVKYFSTLLASDKFYKNFGKSFETILEDKS